MKKQKLTNQQRALASTDLTVSYLYNYYAKWRYVKVLTLKKLIENRYEFYKDIYSEIKAHDDADGQATIAQEIHHGLYHDAISHCVQYIEDLFALLKASKQPDFFIRNVITYKGGEVTNFLKSFKAEAKNLGEVFHFPADLEFPLAENQQEYNDGIKRLKEYVEELIKFYKDYEFFYNQYKHGLSVALRPFGNVFTTEQIAKDQSGELPPFLSVYDNLNLEASFKKGTAAINHGIMMPGLTENVMPFISELSSENNYLRFVHPPDYPNLTIELLIRKAKLTCYCINLFIFNYGWKIKPDDNNYKFQLPLDYNINRVVQCSYRDDNEKKA